MTITNGYATRLQFQNYIATVATGTTAEELIRIANDDTVIDSFLTDASRIIDGATGRQFYLQTGTFYYSQPTNRELFLDRDIVSVVSVTNGNGELVSASEFNLFPLNNSPKFSIRLKESSNVGWDDDGNGNTEGVITVVAVEGYATSIPADIELACLIIAVTLYRQRQGQAPLEGGFVTPAGNILLPGGIPKTAAQLLARYKRSEVFSY